MSEHYPLFEKKSVPSCLCAKGARLAKCLLASSAMTSGVRTFEALRVSRTARMDRQDRRIGAIGQWEIPRVASGSDPIARLVLSHSQDIELSSLYAHDVLASALASPHDDCPLMPVW